jgi:hypothetical protein
MENIKRVHVRTNNIIIHAHADGRLSDEDLICKMRPMIRLRDVSKIDEPIRRFWCVTRSGGILVALQSGREETLDDRHGRNLNNHAECRNTTEMTF